MLNKPVPVFMFHSVGIPNQNWEWSFLTIPYDKFEEQLKFLKNNNFHTVNLSDLYSYIYENIPLPEKSVILTFDDGYADNYTFAYPLLKKYGLKGTIFVNPELVDTRKIKRKTLEDTDDFEALEKTGYLTWDEMKEMEEKGVIDIQSHALTHTWYPVSDEIVDFRHPGDDYGWITWNDNPEKKPFLQLDKKELIKYGAPVYKNEKSLLAKRYFPDPELEKHLIDFVTSNGEDSFFDSKEWKNDLYEEVNRYKKEHSIEDRYETEEEKFKRIKQELADSKRQIEQELDKKVDFLCWPGGSSSQEGLKAAKESGYLMSTAGRDIPMTVRKNIKNDGKIFKDRIGRTSTILLQKKINKNVFKIVFCDDLGMRLRILSFNSGGLFQKILKGLILLYGRIKLVQKRNSV